MSNITDKQIRDIAESLGSPIQGNVVKFARAVLAAATPQHPAQADNEWRKLAHQFDAQRMTAMSHLRMLLAMPTAHAEAARRFLAAAPSEQIAGTSKVPVPGAGPAQAPVLSEREAFEAWLETLMDPDPRANCCIETATELRGDGHYVMSETRIAWDAWQARALLSTAPKSDPTASDRDAQALEIARDALDEIALAGMSGTGQESEEGMRDWHARQAWKFIRIAAQANSKIAAMSAAAKEAK